LTAFDWRNINCLDSSNARFALTLLKFMMSQVCQQALRLAQQIKYLCAKEKGFVKNFSASDADAIQKRMRDMHDRLSMTAVQADGYF